MDLSTLRDLPPWEWPPEAGDLLAATLLDLAADASARRLAAELAGNVTAANDDVARALLAVVRSSEEAPALRGTAAISLGPILEEVDVFGFDDPDAEAPVSVEVAEEIRDTLRRVHLDADAPKEVRRRALEASVRAEEVWHPEAVRAAYHGLDEEWRLTAVFCMRFVGGFEEEIVEALASEEPDIRYQAVRAVGSWGVDAAWSDIRALLRAKGTDRPLLLAAIDAASSIREDEPEEIAAALGHLVDSYDEEIAEAALDALMMAEARLEQGRDT